MDMTVEMNRRLTVLESILTDPVQQAIYGVFKCETETTKGNVYILTTTKNLIEATTTEGNTNPVVVAAESKVDDLGYGQVWTKCVTNGLIWINFESGLTPTTRDYVITSAEEGLAKTVSTIRLGAFGRLIKWSAATNRGLVLLIDKDYRYPILSRITVVNGGDSYGTIECDSDGNDIAGMTHDPVINRAVTAATLSENDKVPLFLCAEDGNFFFSEAT